MKKELMRKQPNSATFTLSNEIENNRLKTINNN